MAVDDDVVRAAAEAAESLIFSRFSASAVSDYDVTVSFDEGVLEVDVFVEVPDASAADEQRAADDAALAAREAADRVLEGVDAGDDGENKGRSEDD